MAQVCQVKRTVEGLHRLMLVDIGTHTVMLMAVFNMLHTMQLESQEPFVSCGAVVDPILLTQRTYNR